MFIKLFLSLPLCCHCADLAYTSYCNGFLINFLASCLFFFSFPKQPLDPAAEIKSSWSNRNLCKCPGLSLRMACAPLKEVGKGKQTWVPTSVLSFGRTVLHAVVTRMLLGGDGHLPFYGAETRAPRDGRAWAISW